MSIFGALSSALCYFLLTLFWEGHTSFWQSLYIIPGGLGNGVTYSTTFIVLTADLDPSQIAIASSGLYLSSNIGMVAGLSIANAILQNTLKIDLERGLEGFPHRDKVRQLLSLAFTRLVAYDILIRGFYTDCS
jgi:hypothetical protein